jgi:hypothetical protein
LVLLLGLVLLRLIFSLSVSWCSFSSLEKLIEEEASLSRYSSF